MSPILLTILVVMLFVGCCLVFVANKLIAANLYERTYVVSHNFDKKSPYTIRRVLNTREYWGYSILKSGKSYNNEWFQTETEVLKVINILEKSEGYFLSKL